MHLLECQLIGFSIDYQPLTSPNGKSGLKVACPQNPLA